VRRHYVRICRDCERAYERSHQSLKRRDEERERVVGQCASCHQLEREARRSKPDLRPEQRHYVRRCTSCKNIYCRSKATFRQTTAPVELPGTCSWCVARAKRTVVTEKQRAHQEALAAKQAHRQRLTAAVQAARKKLDAVVAECQKHSPLVKRFGRALGVMSTRMDRFLTERQA